MAGENREFAVVSGGVTPPAPRQPPPPQPVNSDDGIALTRYLEILWERRWLILGSLLFGALGLVVYLSGTGRAQDASDVDALRRIQEELRG